MAYIQSKSTEYVGTRASLSLAATADDIPIMKFLLSSFAECTQDLHFIAPDAIMICTTNMGDMTEVTAPKSLAKVFQASYFARERRAEDCRYVDR